jgi:acetyl-CoA carboxylase, biotin carboxylase subunit
LRIAAGEPLGLTQEDVHLNRHAIECRINAESVESGFVPSPGVIDTWLPPVGVRVDSHVYPGYVVPPYYDSLLAKLVVDGPDRASAIENLGRALSTFVVGGVDTTIDLHRRIAAHSDFRANEINTQWLEQVVLPSLEMTTPRRN